MKTYLDSGVLITAWRQNDASSIALQIITDDQREFITSQFVMLEVLPQARFGKQLKEQAFYSAYFSDAMAVEPLSEALGREAAALADRYGLSGADALHVAAALRHGAQEFYTTEKSTKPMFRVKELKVISLHSLVT